MIRMRGYYLAGPDERASKLGFAGLNGEQSEGRNRVLMAVGWVEGAEACAIRPRHQRRFLWLGSCPIRKEGSFAHEFFLCLGDCRTWRLPAARERPQTRPDSTKSELLFRLR
jgi:hypothetical protein